MISKTTFRRLHCAAALTALVAGVAHTTQAQVNPAASASPGTQAADLSVDRLQVLTPENINRAPVLAPVAKAREYTDEDWTLYARYKGLSLAEYKVNSLARRERESFAADSGANLNETEALVHPFPEINAVGADSMLPMGTNPGIEAVEATVRQWEWSAKEKRTIGPLPPRRVWRWNVPEERKTDWPFLNLSGPLDRYSALCLLPSVATPYREPVVYLFDAAARSKPVVWQAEVPIQRVLLAYRAAYGGDTVRDSGSPLVPLVYLAVTNDGSRVLVFATSGPLAATVVFVYDGANGTLLRTNILRNVGTAISGMIDAGRPNSPYFLVDLAWLPPAAPVAPGEKPARAVRGSVLFNTEGDIVARFVNSAGQPERIASLNDNFATDREPAGPEKNPDGTPKASLTVYYDLPIAKPKTPAPATPKPATAPTVALPAATQPVGPKRLDPPPPPRNAPPRR